MCSSEVARKMWIRLRSAWRTASHARSTSLNAGAGQPGDDRAAHGLGDRLDRLEVAVAGDREPGLDDVDPETRAGRRSRASRRRRARCRATARRPGGSCRRSAPGPSGFLLVSVGSDCGFGHAKANKKPLGPKAREVLASTWRRSPLRKEQSVEVRHQRHRTWQSATALASSVNHAPMRENAPVLKLLRRGAIAGLLAGGAYAAWRFLASRAPDTGGMTFQTSPFPGPPVPCPRPPNFRPRPEPWPCKGPLARGAPWVEPDDGSCPLTHPIKAKLSSGIFHVPGRRQLRPHPRRTLLRRPRRRDRRRPPLPSQR